MHLVIVRTGGSVLNIDTYNCQELGLAKVLVQKGWSVSLVLAGNKLEERIVHVGEKKIHVFYVTFKSINQALSSFNGIFPLLERLNPTHIQIHEFGMWMSYKVVRWAKERNIPVFLIQGSYQPTQKPVFKQLEKLFNLTYGKYVLQHVKGIGCKSNMARQYVSQYCDRKTMLTPIGLDESRFFSCEQINWREKLHLDEKHILLYVGILEPRRNPLFLLDVIEKTASDTILLIIGSGPMEDAVKKEIEQRKLQKKCLMLGKLRQEQLPSLYQTSDLFLLASDYEIYGMVLLEALFFGLPIITTLTAGSEMLIESGKNGFVVEKDRSVWAKKIKEILGNERMFSEMKRYAVRNIQENYVWNKAAVNFERLYLNRDEDITNK